MDRELVDIDPSLVRSAVVLDRPNSPSPADAERDDGPETVELVLRLSREEALRLMEKLGQGEDQQGSDNVSAQDAENRRPTRSSTRLRTSSRAKESDVPRPPSRASPPPSSRRSTNNGAPSTPVLADAHQVPEQPQSASSDSKIQTDLQNFLDSERSYTNAFHKTLSLFVDDKTFSTPSLRAAVVGFLESSNATVLDTLYKHENDRVPVHLRQEIENHVNLVKTVLQRGGVFAEDMLRGRLNKLAGHIPRIEAAIGGNRTKLGSSKAPMLYPSDPYGVRGVSPETAAANAAALAQAAEAVARVNSRHHEMLASVNGPPLAPDPSMHLPPPFHGGPPPPMGPTPPLPVPGPQQGPMPGPIPQSLPPMRGKTFVPPNMVPSPVNGGPPRPEESGGGGSPPPILAPFDPRPNPMACLFCRQRKIRCIGHKPHPCEICVKRGFVCSYDWISRRGKRKPKNPDGTPIDPPAGSVSVAVSGDGSQTVGGVPVVVPPNGPPGPHPPPPAVGMHPAPGMHPMHMGVMPPGQPGPDGSVPPFAFAFIPPPSQGFPAAMAHPGVPGVQLPPLNPESLSPSGPSSATGSPPAVRNHNTGDEMVIDPSLMDNSTPAPNGAGLVGEDFGAKCTFCRDQELECGGNAPEPCLNCSRRQLTCKYEERYPAHAGGKKRGGAQNGRTKKKRGAGEETAAAGKKQKTVHPQEDISMNGDTPANGASADGDAEMDDQGDGTSSKDGDGGSKADSVAAVEAAV